MVGTNDGGDEGGEGGEISADHQRERGKERRVWTHSDYGRFELERWIVLETHSCAIVETEVMVGDQKGVRAETLAGWAEKDQERRKERGAKRVFAEGGSRRRVG